MLNISSNSVDCKLLLSRSHLKIHKIGVTLPIALTLDKWRRNIAFKSKTSTAAPKAVRRIMSQN